MGKTKYRKDNSLELLISRFCFLLISYNRPLHFKLFVPRTSFGGSRKPIFILLYLKSNGMKGKQKQVVAATKRSGQKVSTPIDGSITRFTSRGAVGQSSSVGNSFMNLFQSGNPYDGNQQGKYNEQILSIDLLAYFAANLFNAYDYFRVVDCETTFTWASAPENGGPVMGEMLWVVDRDSRESEEAQTIANRTSAQTRTFDNCNLRRIVNWKPYLVEDSTTSGVVGAQVDYVQPRSRWLNSKSVDQFRFGTLRVIGQCYDGSQYQDNNPILQWRHRLIIEMKGLKTLLPQNATPIAHLFSEPEIHLPSPKQAVIGSEREKARQRQSVVSNRSLF